MFRGIDIVDTREIYTDETGNQISDFSLYALLHLSDEEIEALKSIQRIYSSKHDTTYTEQETPEYAVYRIGKKLRNVRREIEEIEPTKICGSYFCGFSVRYYDEDEFYGSRWLLTRVENPAIRIHLDPINPEKDIVDPAEDDLDDDNKLLKMILDKQGIPNDIKIEEEE